MPHRHSQRIGPFALTRTLAWLRICAIAGQSTAVLVCAWWMRLSIPLLPLLLGIGLLGVFSVFAAWRLTQPWPLREWEAVGHIAFDTLVLGYLLYFTGGASNPFITLLLVPIALSAAALSGRAVLAVAALAGVAYVILLYSFVPLPLPMPAGSTSRFTLHVVGMGVNFVIMALLLSFFISRLARVLQLQQLEVQRVRERALRDEGILAIATQAAGAAHELNTPLSTMRTLLPELRREHAGDATLAEDLALLEGQVDRCRTILREMVAFGKAQLSQEPERLTVAAFIHGCLERFQLLRPEAELDLALDPEIARVVLRTPPGLRHALLNLLNNAADASAINQSHAVALQVARDGDWLQLGVRDHGPGFDATGELTLIGHSQKQTGLGIGLALAEATAERLNGELVASNTGHGAEVCLRLPLAVIAEK
ncbi:two-component sensor histidine kinase [Rhodanobacter sp. FW510-R12]|uniref:ATP-binding protein n=1 Tax=unclassified Rhodanobacter TaxID=2621553 RepID=UPI0007A9FBF6|nr:MULTISPECIES: ATP-binding protein [unclassified Rhodanobacter]KZC15321.1 two-component sensor histidine kinase [Rhodanobacter sp. FW104-R8]KZC27785.1 two-component sensor histidine kinase [Rhodanobacter sp. FW510-T8]KZC30112.1 two-component sensor histidine kinase [Rhodanobacter sp. FW510-R10]